MFAGIVTESGRILALENRGGDRRLVIGFERAVAGGHPGGGVAEIAGGNAGGSAGGRAAKIAAGRPLPRVEVGVGVGVGVGAGGGVGVGARVGAGGGVEVEVGGSVAVDGVCLTAVERTADRFAADVSKETLRVTTLGRLEPGHRVNLEASLKLGQRIDGHLVTGHVDGVGEVLSLTESGRSLALEIAVPAPLARYIARKGSIAVDGVSLTVNAVSRDCFAVNVIPHTRAVTIISGYAVGTPVNIEVDLIARYLERLVAPDAGGIDLDMLRKHGFARHE
jgi:riboflavin synthase